MARSKTPDGDPKAIDPRQPLLTFIPAASEQLVSPTWLREYCETLDGLPYTNRRVVVDAPRRHTKSTTVHHAVAKWLLLYPKLEIIYYTYGLAFSYEQSRRINSIYRRCGGRIGDRDTQAHWTTPEGGGVFATSRDGSLVGRGGDIGIIDDPLKNRAEAEAAEVRELTDSAIRNDLIPCLKKDSPVLWVASRYSPDDPSGRALKRGADHVHYRAIEHPRDVTLDDALATGEARALWPEERPLSYLANLRQEIGEYAFVSNYQGEPQPPSSTLFMGTHHYRLADDRKPLRVIVGVDLGFTRRGDYSVLVVLWDMGDHYRVRHVLRGQWPIGRTRAEILALQMNRAICPITSTPMRMVAHVSGPEIGVYDLLLEQGIVIERLPARFSILQRAQRTSGGWSNGMVRLPVEESESKWVDDLVSEIRYFTGIDDLRDDQIAALCSAYDAAEGARSHGGFAPGHMLGSRCM